MPLTVPPMTRSPGPFSTGIGSPVIIDSSTALVPSSTTPSTGTFSPGRTRSRSPTWTSSSGTSSSRPSARSRRAVFGARPSSAWMALDGLAPGPQLEHLAEQDQRRDDRGGLEVDRDVPVMVAERGREDAGEERRDDAVDVRRAGAERDQREHVEAAVHDARPSRGRRTASRPRGRPASRARAGSRRATARGRDARSSAGRRSSRPSRGGAAGPCRARQIQNRRRHVHELGVRVVPGRRHRLERHAADRADSRACPGRSPGASGRCRGRLRSALWRALSDLLRRRDSAPGRRRTSACTTSSRRSRSSPRARSVPRPFRDRRPSRRPGP